MKAQEYRNPIPPDNGARPELCSPLDQASMELLRDAKNQLAKPASWLGDDNKRQLRVAELQTDMAQRLLYR